jgi:aldose 1-epimerase
MLYKSQHIFNPEKKLNYVVLQNDLAYAKIVLNQGASLQELTLNSISVIQDLHPLKYKNTFASSILFPFSSRIENGKYLFEDIEYQTEINELERNNSLHGFVYNKEFQIVSQFSEKEKASIVLEYNETKLTKGFPFTYKIQLEYILQDTSLELKVNVQNTSIRAFPFTLGWHPYFTSTDLFNSTLKFDSDKKVIFDNRMITSDVEEFIDQSELEIKNCKLDDCFYLNASKVKFVTPSYTLEMISSSENDFLQVYTPPKKNTIAIEPTTGISDSFNNEIGLKTLKPSEEFAIAWQVQIINH